MKNDFLNELKSIAMESAGVESYVDPYAGSMCAEERVTLDILDDHEMAMESYTEALFAETFDTQELALESAELTFAEISKFNGELSMESVANAVKRGAYGAQIQFKKVAQKIMKFIMSIIDYFRVADGKFKSYNKLFKKYKEKLNKVTPASATGDKEEKEYTIRNWDGLAQEFTDFRDGVNTNAISNAITAASGTNINSLKDALFGFIGSSNHGITEGADEETFDRTVDEFKERIKDEIKELKDSLKDSRETEEGTFHNLKSKVIGWIDTAIQNTGSDIKYKKDISKLKSKMNKFASKNIKDDTSDADIIAIRHINKIATPILNMVQTKASMRYKHLASGYQGLLADSAKLISAGTRVND